MKKYAFLLALFAFGWLIMGDQLFTFDSILLFVGSLFVGGIVGGMENDPIKLKKKVVIVSIFTCIILITGLVFFLEGLEGVQFLFFFEFLVIPAFSSPLACMAVILGDIILYFKRKKITFHQGGV